MARLKYGTPDYERAFGSVPEVPLFTSTLPEYYALTQAWADPSLRVDLGLDSADAMNAKLAKDVQLGGQRMMWSMAVPGVAANIPHALIDGIRELTFSETLPSLLPESNLMQVFDPANRPAGGRGLIGVGIGAAMTAIGCSVPIVGQIAAVLLAIGLAIYKALHANKVKKDLAEAKAREELYKSFPPLQSADSATDTQIARRVHAIMETDDWTDIFLPRFKGDWLGRERQTGYAFAPGESTVKSQEFGQDIEAFVPTGGIGCIPNTGLITSVIQVNLDPQGAEFKKFMKTGNYDPREQFGGASRVVDTGSFYTATANQASLAFSIITEDRGLHGNAFLYRIDVKAIADAWQDYFLSGLDYIRAVALPWWESDRDDNSSLEGFFASAVFFGVGAWAKRLSGGTTEHPKYSMYEAPYGIYRNAMAQEGLYKFSEYAGAFLPIRGSMYGLTTNMGSQWERGPNVKQTCADLAAQQIHDLQHTFVCMYVRRAAKAFTKNQQLREMLDAKRRLLLKRPERVQITLSDIPEDETLDGKPLRQLAIEAGVPPMPAKGPMNKSAPIRPKLPGFQGGEAPWSKTAPPSTSFAKKLAIGGGLGALLVAAARRFR